MADAADLGTRVMEELNTAATSTQAQPPAASPTTTEPTSSTSDDPTTTTTITTTSSDPTTTTEPPATTPPSSSSTETTTSSPTTTSTTTTTATTTSSTTSSTSSESESSSEVPTSTTFTSSSETKKSTTIIVTSTDTLEPTHATGNGADSATTSIGGTSATATPTGQSGGSGLSAGGTIAVAVVVPVVTVALIVLAALYFWRKWKAKKAAEEERRKEVEEYGFNPNNDPTLPPIMGGSAYEPKDDTSGYRGWGTTSAGRKASTNMSSSVGAGLAMSEAGSAPGYHHAATPSEGTIQYSEGHGHPAETEPLGILGAGPVAASNNRTTDIHRGPSNASSAYSAANRSDVSDESHMSATHPTGPYYGENPYYDDMQQQYGGYSDGPYGAGQPVIRDVQARRNTRIENPSVFPRQGNAGIAQNF